MGSITPNEDWNSKSIRKFFDAWERWHSNDMQACLPAQEQFLRENLIKGVMDHYTRACEALAATGLYPDSNYIRKGEPYKYGSAWLFEELPNDVLEYFASLPESKLTPAWV